MNTYTIAEYGEICAKVGEIEKSEVENYLLSDIATRLISSHENEIFLPGIVATFQMTVETQTSHAEVKERAIHAAAGSPFKPGYR